MKKWYQQTWFIILSLILFFPVGICFIWTCSDWKKNTKIITTCIIACLCVSCLFFSSDSQVETPNTTPTPTLSAEVSSTVITSTPYITNTPKPTPFTYSQLENLYLSLDAPSYQVALDAIISSGLPYTDQKYNHAQTICVAYTKDSALQKYAEPGDHLEIHYFVNNNNEKILSYIAYHQQTPMGSAIAFYDGSYFDLHGTECAGLYVSDGFSKENGYIVTYANGNSHKTNYVKMYNKSSQLSWLKNLR